jgi:hypothetical protein
MQIVVVVCAALACQVWAGEGQSYSVSRQSLSPTYKGGIIVGEIMEVTASKEERNNLSRVSGVIRLKITEAIGGSIKPGEVQVDFSRQIGGVVRYPSAWQRIEPRVGLQVVAELHEQESNKGRYQASAAAPLDKVDKDYLQGDRQIAALLKIENVKDRLAVMDRLDFKAQPRNVQIFILEQTAHFKEPSIGLEQLSRVFHDTQHEYVVRWNAGSFIHELLFDRTTGQDNTQAVDALIKGLQDPNPDIRGFSLDALKYIAAREDPLKGTFKINQHTIDEIENCVKREKNEKVRKRALEVQQHIRSILAKMRSGR